MAVIFFISRKVIERFDIYCDDLIIFLMRLQNLSSIKKFLEAIKVLVHRIFIKKKKFLDVLEYSGNKKILNTNTKD